jgi:anti-sigma B factor antagonist
MNINVKTVERVTVVEIAGKIDGKTAPEVERRVSGLVQPGSRIILDMTQVSYMSSAGLRMLVATYRQVFSGDGRIVLVGLGERIRDTMTVTGFMRYFAAYETVEAGLAALEEAGQKWKE